MKALILFTLLTVSIGVQCQTEKIKQKSMFEFKGDWEFKMQFEMLKSFRNASGSYTGIVGRKNEGWVNVIIQDDLSLDPDPLPSQINTLNYLIENEAIFFSKVLEYVYEDYPRIQKIYGGDEEDREESVPDIDSPEGMRKIIGVGNIFISMAETDGFAQIGLECGCTWDEEHGLGLAMDRTRLIEIGDASSGLGGGGGNYIPPERPIRYKPHPKYGKLKPSHAYENGYYPFKVISKKLNEDFIKEYEAGEIDSASTWRPTDASLLEYSVARKNMEIANFLLEKGHDISGVLHKCVTFKPFDREILDFALKNGADINHLQNGRSILHGLVGKLATTYYYKTQAIKSGRTPQVNHDEQIATQKELIRHLILKGSDPYLGEKKSNQAIHAGGTMEPGYRKEMTEFLEACVAERESKTAKPTIEKSKPIPPTKKAIPKKKKPWWKFW